MAEAAITAVAVAWGTSYVAMKIVTDSVAITDFLVLRFVAAALPLTAFGLRGMGRYTRREVFTGLEYGALLFAILYMETLGVHLSSAANAGFLIATNVVIIPILDRLLYRTAVSPLIAPVLVCAVAGTALTTLSGGLHLAGGDALILGAATLRALQTVMYAHHGNAAPASPVRVTIVQMWTVAALAFMVGGANIGRISAAATGQSTTDLLLIGYLGVACTAAAFLAQLWAGPRLPATTVGLLLATEPIFAGISAIVLGGDAVSLGQIAGGALIVTAVLGGRYLTTRFPRREPGDRANAARA